MRTGRSQAHRNAQGKSLVHGVGHWLGLLHTSHGSVGDDGACDASLPGDYVSDTPAQSVMNTLDCEVCFRAVTYCFGICFTHCDF